MLPELPLEVILLSSAIEFPTAACGLSKNREVLLAGIGGELEHLNDSGQSLNLKLPKNNDPLQSGVSWVGSTSSGSAYVLTFDGNLFLLDLASFALVHVDQGKEIQFCAAGTDRLFGVSTDGEFGVVESGVSRFDKIPIPSKSVDKFTFVEERGKYLMLAKGILHQGEVASNRLEKFGSRGTIRDFAYIARGDRCILLYEHGVVTSLQCRTKVEEFLFNGDKGLCGIVYCFDYLLTFAHTGTQSVVKIFEMKCRDIVAQFSVSDDITFESSDQCDCLILAMNRKLLLVR